ncbi:MAG: hypothetical protein ACLPWS_20000 [Rhodomicrobium sp.]
MKSHICFAAALLAAAILGGEARALPASPAEIAATAPAIVKVRYRSRHRRNGGLFSQWCAYNCYTVPPCAHSCFGRYGYSHYAYDQDLPFRYRYDWDAIPTDNALGLAYPVTGEPVMRLFEHTY